jgi:hypothetical protein
MAAPVNRKSTCTGLDKESMKSAYGSRAAKTMVSVSPGGFRNSSGKEERRATIKHQAIGFNFGRIRRQNEPAAARNFKPPFPFPPPGASRGGEGSPHAATRIAPAKGAGTLRAAAPPARGISKRSAEIPLAPSPYRLPEGDLLWPAAARKTFLLSLRQGGRFLGCVRELPQRASGREDYCLWPAAARKIFYGSS